MNKQRVLIKSELVETINSLRNLLIHGTLDPIGAAGIETAMKRNIEKFISEHHHNAITFREDKALWQTKVPPDRKRITAKTEEALKMKLFDYYTGQEEQNRVYTLESLFPKWMEERKTLRPSETTDHNAQDWAKYLESTDFVKTDIRKITVAQWSDFSLHLVGNGKMKQRCYGNIKAVVNGLMDYAARKGYIPSNILRGGTKMELNFAEETGHEDNPEDAFTSEEKEQLFSFLMSHIKEESEDLRYACLLILQMSTGIRVGELKALHWSDYNENEGTLYIHRSIVYRKVYDNALEREVKRPTEIQRTKGKKKEANRVLPLTENAVMALDILKGISNGSEYVVTNQAGSTIDTNKYNKWIKRYCDKAGIREHSSHDSRRYAISALLDSGVPLETVKTFAGHLETSTTASYFRRIQDNKFSEAFKKALA